VGVLPPTTTDDFAHGQMMFGELVPAVKRSVDRKLAISNSNGSENEDSSKRIRVAVYMVLRRMRPPNSGRRNPSGPREKGCVWDITKTPHQLDKPQFFTIIFEIDISDKLYDFFLQSCVQLQTAVKVN
jgi:hypothetical protein